MKAACSTSDAVSKSPPTRMKLILTEYCSYLNIFQSYLSGLQFHTSPIKTPPLTISSSPLLLTRKNTSMAPLPPLLFHPVNLRSIKITDYSINTVARRTDKQTNKWQTGKTNALNIIQICIVKYLIGAEQEQARRRGYNNLKITINI